MVDSPNENTFNDALRDQKIGSIVSSSLYKLEHISNHHVKERRKSYRITNLFVITVAIFILMIAVANLYNLHGFYNETIVIVDTVNSLDSTVETISSSMISVTASMEKINRHVKDMEGVYLDVSAISGVMPLMQNNMALVGGDMGSINNGMDGINKNMNAIDFHLKSMSSNVSRIRYNIRQISEPMGKFNSMLP